MYGESYDDDETEETGYEYYNPNVPHDDFAQPKDGNIDTDHHTNKNFKYEHPVENLKDLGNSVHLEKILRNANLEEEFPVEERTANDEKQINKAFDKKALKHTSVILKEESLTPGENVTSLEPRCLHALVLMNIREYSYQNFSSYLQESEFAKDLLKIECGPSTSTISKWKRKLDEDQYERLSNSAERLQFALFRSGTYFPADVKEDLKEKLPFEKEVDEVVERYLTPKVKVDAFCNWAEEFVDRCIVEPLDLGRDPVSATYPIESFYGLLAHAALQSVTMESAHKSCEEWLINPDYVPHGKTVRDWVRKLSVTEISEMFHEANKQFLDFASDYTIIDGSKDVAYDTTDILFAGNPEEQPWAKGFAETMKYRKESEENLKWEFGILGIMENDVRFALGLYPIDDETDYADGLNRVLKEPRKNSDIPLNKVMMDRGLSGARLVDRCRSLVGENWIMNAPKNSKLKKLVKDTPQGEDNFEPNIDYLKDITIKPNAYVVPVMEDWNHTDDDHMVFLTDLPEEKLNEDYIKNKYRARGRIEKTLEQVKCHFRVPRQRSNKREEAPSLEWEYFLINLSMLYYNLHNLIDNCLSPKHFLPLGEREQTTWNVVLTAIRIEAFNKAKEE